MYDRIALHDFLLLLMVMPANVWGRKMAYQLVGMHLPTDQYAVNEKIGGLPRGLGMSHCVQKWIDR
jgi:hypothetical protein